MTTASAPADVLAAAFASFMPGSGRRVSEPVVERLVRAARLGSTEAAGRLYTLHAAQIYRAVRPLCASEADAEDVTQDAFVDALSHLARYDARPETRFVAWLATIALNRARRRARARRAQEEGAALVRASAVDIDPDPEERLVSRAALLGALARLPARDREVLALFHGAGLTAGEVGRAVGVGEANVRKICERRRRDLLSALGERLEEP